MNKITYINANRIAAFLIVLITLWSCSNSSFRIEGTIADADNESLIIEKSDFYGRWIPIDSTRTNKSGKFSISIEAPAAPEIYRLCLGDRFIYFPIDSTETITLKTSLANFGISYELTGSEQAGMMARFDTSLASAPKSQDSLAAFKSHIFNEYLMNSQGNVLSYYILTKVVDGKALYNPEDRTDMKYFAAVATAYKNFNPDDPRTALLEDISLKALRKRNSDAGIGQYIEADQPKILEIELPDETGTQRKLSSSTGAGKPTILVFAPLTHPDSPSLNMLLAKFYEQKGVSIYHVGTDEDRYAWRDAAKNIPWTTVYGGEGLGNNALKAYNITSLPTFFIIDRNGDLIDRAENFETLSAQMSAY